MCAFIWHVASSAEHSLISNSKLRTTVLPTSLLVTMKFQAFIAVTLALLQTGFSSALPEGASVAARDDKRGSEQIAGLGSRKQQVTGAGGTTMDLAIAMLETKNMGTDYTYGMYHPLTVDKIKSADAIMYFQVMARLEMPRTLESSSRIGTCSATQHPSFWDRVLGMLKTAQF